MKIYILFIGLSCLSSIILMKNRQKSTVEIPDLLVENIEALAQGEVIIPGACALVEQLMCMLFSDGYFLIGKRVG